MKTVKRFWIEESGFEDLDNGWAEWSDGTESFTLDVHRAYEGLTDLQIEFLHSELIRLAPGLNLEQLSYMYDGIFSMATESDYPETWKKEQQA